MSFTGITYQGGSITDTKTFASLPNELQTFYESYNGLVICNGGFHFKSCSIEPKWISLFNFWKGDNALYKVYESIELTDIPFGHDCFGDHFFLRGNYVMRLYSESGEIESLDVDFNGFVEKLKNDPVDYLILEPLLRYEYNNPSLQPGELLNVYPPFIMEEAKNGVSIKNVPALEQVEFLCSFYNQIKDLKDGEKINIKIIK